MKGRISFHSQDISFSLKNKSKIKKWILSAIRKEKRTCDIINFVFCSDKFLLKLNKEYLQHNTLTDIITFEYSAGNIQSDIFISVLRVKENAKKFEVAFNKELQRVMIHGALHLCGYKGKTVSEKRKIKAREDYYLSLAD